jgi:hypothetical protein
MRGASVPHVGPAEHPFPTPGLRSIRSPRRACGASAPPTRRALPTRSLAQSSARRNRKPTLRTLRHKFRSAHPPPAVRRLSVPRHGVRRFLYTCLERSLACATWQT